MTVIWDDTKFQKQIKVSADGMLAAIARHVVNTTKTIITQKDIIDTGTLRRSITYADKPPRGGVVRVGTNMEYAPFLEFGHRTRGGTNVAPRSFLRAALDQLNQSTVDRIIARQRLK